MNFIINASNTWKNSIDIIFNPEEEVNVINLFLILKSYLLSNQPKIKSIYSICYNIDSEKKNLISKSINVYMMNRLNFDDFYNWYYEQYEDDYEYIKTSQNYGFRLVFYSQSLKDENSLLFLKPNYPWSEEKIHFFNIYKDNYRSEIEKLKKEILDLKSQRK